MRSLVLLASLLACGKSEPEQAKTAEAPRDARGIDASTLVERKCESIARRAIISTTPVTVTVDDSDGDGLSNHEEDRLCTNKTNVDTDGDGLWDSWEVHIVNGLDLAHYQASPRRRDVFVYMNYAKRLAPTEETQDAIRHAMASAPVQNVDPELHGIGLHLVDGGALADHESTVFKSLDRFYAIKSKRFPAEWAPIAHYMIWGESFCGSYDSGLSLWGAKDGVDFIVTLGVLNGGKPAEQIGTFIHELGHNLGLIHQGPTNQQPNHISVMNYDFQMSGIHDGSEPHYWYQRGSTIDLEENSLDESAGIGSSSALKGYQVVWRHHGNVQEATAGAAINWTVDGGIETGVRNDLDGNSKWTKLRGVSDEWERLKFASANIIGSSDDIKTLKARRGTASCAQPKSLLDELDTLTAAKLQDRIKALRK